MAEEKITQLPAAATPLAGTEVLPIVQSGVTVQAAVSDVALALELTFGTGVATFLVTPTSANLAAAVTNETGTGLLVFATSPTLTTPILGTPTSGTLTNCTIPVGQITGAGTGVLTALAVNVGSAGAPVTFNGALGTPSSGTLTNCTLPVGGVTGLGTGVATFLATPSSANLASAITDETGTGLAVFNTNPVMAGVVYVAQGNPVAADADATLTIANLLTLMVTTTSSSAVALTLPTGSDTDAGILSGALANNSAFGWVNINLGSSSGAQTLTANTAHTIVGNPVVAISTTGRFLTRKTAANTFVTYRVG